MGWEPDGDEHWSIDMRCGDCGHSWNTVITNSRAERLDVQLDGDMYVLRQALRSLDLERMTAEVEAFAAALDRDLVEPADFAR
jgi:hypothetical protein